MRLTISNAASDDLENIWLYTFNNWSLEQADRYLSLIFDEIEFLATIPESGTPYSNVRKGYFRAKVKSHYIFYKVNFKKSEIEIIRILHERMDVDNHLIG